MFILKFNTKYRGLNQKTQPITSFKKKHFIFVQKNQFFSIVLTSKSQSDMDIEKISKYIMEELFLVNFIVGILLTLLGMGGLFRPPPPKRKQIMLLILLNEHFLKFSDFLNQYVTLLGMAGLFSPTLTKTINALNFAK